MNLDTIVALGSRPWLPCVDASNLDVWHEDDVPVLGTFELPDGPVLFSLIGTADKAVTAWAYLPLDEVEYKELREIVYDDVLQMNEDVQRRFESRDRVYAVARDFSVASWKPSYEPASSLVEGATEFLRDYISVVRGELDVLHRRLEQLEAIHLQQSQHSAHYETRDEVWTVSVTPVRARSRNEEDRFEALEETQARAEELVG